MGYLLLAGTILLLFLFFFYIEGWEVLAPAPLCCLAFAVSLILSYIGTNSWNNIDLEPSASVIVLIGCAFFSLGGVLVTKGYRRGYLGSKAGRTTLRSSMKETGEESRTVALWRYILLLAVVFFAIALRVFETYQLGNKYGIEYTSYWDLSKSVRNATESFMGGSNIKFDEGFSIIGRQLDKFVRATAFVSAFLSARLIYGTCFQKKKAQVTKNISSFALVIFSCFYFLICGGRTTILYVCIAFVTVCFILALRDGRNTLKTSVSLLLLGVLAMLAASVVFYYAAALIGRPAKSGMVDYISFYFGCGTPSLQWLLTDTLGISIDGKTFFNLNAFLYKFGLVGNPGSSSIDWLWFDSNHASNIFTAFGGMYFDFGCIGVSVLSFISGAFYTLLYRLGRLRGNIFGIMIYGYLAPTVFDMARKDFFCSNLLSVGQILLILLMVGLLWFLTVDKNDLVARAHVLQKMRGAER